MLNVYSCVIFEIIKSGDINFIGTFSFSFLFFTLFHEFLPRTILVYELALLVATVMHVRGCEIRWLIRPVQTVFGKDALIDQVLVRSYALRMHLISEKIHAQLKIVFLKCKTWKWTPLHFWGELTWARTFSLSRSPPLECWALNECTLSSFDHPAGRTGTLSIPKKKLFQPKNKKKRFWRKRILTGFR